MVALTRRHGVATAGAVLYCVGLLTPLSQTTGHFPDSQDQRNTFRTRGLYQAWPRLWLAAGATYGSGLPFEYTGDESDALAQYGQQMIDRKLTLPAHTTTALLERLLDVPASAQPQGSRRN